MMRIKRETVSRPSTPVTPKHLQRKQCPNSRPSARLSCRYRRTTMAIPTNSFIIPSRHEEHRILDAKNCKQEGVQAGAKAVVIAIVVSVVPARMRLEAKAEGGRLDHVMIISNQGRLNVQLANRMEAMNANSVEVLASLSQVITLCQVPSRNTSYVICARKGT